MYWARQDASPDQAQTDMRECQQSAYLEAQRRFSWMHGRMGPYLHRDSMGRLFHVYPAGPFSDPYGEAFMEEHRLANFCMRSRGYQLVPEPKAAEAKKS